MPRDAWDSADAYEPYVGRWSRALAPRFLEWARVPRAAAALDVGCGTGALSEALLKRGAKRLVGIDPSAAYVEKARAALGRDGKARFDVGDAMRLTFRDGEFDAAVAALVLNFVPDPLQAVRQMKRVVRRGGVVAGYVWDYAGKMEMMRHFWDAAIALDPKRAGPLDEGVRFPLCSPDRLNGLFEAAGLDGVETTHIDQPTRFRDFADYWTPFLSGQGPAPGYCMGLPEPARNELREVLRSGLPTRPDGTIHLVARALAVRGTA